MFHIELRQFPHVTRAFNLSGAQLQEQILGPWTAGTVVHLNDRRWSPERAKLSIYEGPKLAPEQIGLGRGWANATSSGEEVTEEVVARARREAAEPPELDELKREIEALCAESPLSLGGTMRLAERRHPQARLSDRLALAERAVWELLHAGRVRVVHAEVPVGGEAWAPTLLSWEMWLDPETVLVPANGT